MTAINHKPASRRVLFTIPAHTIVKRCKGCPAIVAFIYTDSNKPMPVDLPPGWRFVTHGLGADAPMYTEAAYQGESHFATCPAAASFRKPKKIAP